MKSPILVFVLVCLALLCCCLGLFLFNVSSLLTVSDYPGDVDVIICLSGKDYLSKDNRLKRAVSLLRHGKSQNIILTSKASLKEAKEYNIDQASMLVTEKDASTTFQEAVYSKSILLKHNFRSAIIVSYPYHLYRVKWTFQHVCRDLPVKFFYVSANSDIGKTKWWKNKRDRHLVLSEIPKIIYYYFYHGMIGLSIDPEWNKRLKSWYSRLLLDLDDTVEEWE